MAKVESYWQRYRNRDKVQQYEAGYSILAQYNAECARGVMHTPEWIEFMEILHARWEDPNDGLRIN